MTCKGIARLLGEARLIALRGDRSLLDARLRAALPDPARTARRRAGANAVALALTAVANTQANRRFTFGVRGRQDLVRHHLSGAARLLPDPRPDQRRARRAAQDRPRSPAADRARRAARGERLAPPSRATSRCAAGSSPAADPDRCVKPSRPWAGPSSESSFLDPLERNSRVCTDHPPAPTRRPQSPGTWHELAAPGADRPARRCRRALPVGARPQRHGNEYYSAAVRSMSSSWHAFLYGSFDSAGVMTVDKPPLALWVQALSVRAFGFSSWSDARPAGADGRGGGRARLRPGAPALRPGCRLRAAG